MRTLHTDRIWAGSGIFWIWDSFYKNYLSDVVKPEFTTLSQPNSLKNRMDIHVNKVKIHSNERLDYNSDPGKPYINRDCDLKNNFDNCITLRRIKDYETDAMY